MNVNDKLLLAKCIGLLYNEVMLSEEGSEPSVELVRSVISTIQVSEIGIGVSTDRDTIVALKDLVLYMCEHHDEKYDEFDILQRVKLCCANNDSLYSAISEGILTSRDMVKSKKYIVSAHKFFQNHLKQVRFYEILNNASNTYKFHREKIKNFNEFVGDLIAQLEPLQVDIRGDDPAIMGDIDLGDDVKVREIFKELKEVETGNRLYRLGWQGINRMFQGGIRPGETVIMAGLQHNYKTGFSLSIFKQIALYNKPLTIDPNKKPLLLRISFEDNLSDNIQFLFQSLYYTENGVNPPKNEFTEEQMAKYIKEKLQVNGFTIKMLRVDPSQWTYKHLINKVIEFETNGYAVEVLMVDYLAMIPTTGCVQGPAGVDIRDLFRRMRNFCAGRKIAFITPHQLSTDAKMLTRNGVPDEQLVKELVGRGFFAGSKQIDQEADLIVYIHICKDRKTKNSYLAVQRDKHRLPSIIDEEDKYLLLPFPKKAAIPDDILGEEISIRKLSTAVKGNVDDDFFELKKN